MSVTVCKPVSVETPGIAGILVKTWAFPKFSDTVFTEQQGQSRLVSRYSEFLLSQSSGNKKQCLMIAKA